jgi:hypothetical protein
MSDVIITHTVNGDTRETEMTDPAFIDVLINVGEVSVDGKIFTDVTQVRYKDE